MLFGGSFDVAIGCFVRKRWSMVMELCLPDSLIVEEVGDFRIVAEL